MKIQWKMRKFMALLHENLAIKTTKERQKMIWMIILNYGSIMPALNIKILY